MKRIYTFLLAIIIIAVLPMTVFADNAQITKAQFIKKALDTAGVQIKEVSESDLEGVVEKEYIPYIETALERAIISDNEKLNLNSPLTKQEAVVILVRIFGEEAKVKDITQEIADSKMEFTDEACIIPFAKPYIAYALDMGIINERGNSFYPVKILNEKISKQMIATAKKAYEDHFIREGLTSSEMLLLADEKLRGYDTYKINGGLNLDIKMNVKAMPLEGELEQQLSQQLSQELSGQNMNIDLDVHVQNPHNIYIKEIVTLDSDKLVEQQAEQQIIEIFMDESVMYQKMSQSGDKWIKSDVSSLIQQIQSIKSSPENVCMLSEEQLEFFKDYSSYGDDEKIKRKEYYVINVDVDKDGYKKFFNEYTKKILDLSLQQQKENSLLQEEDVPMEMVIQLVKQMVDKMDIEVSYKFYINKETKNYEKMWISQNLYMNMSDLFETISTLQKDSKEDEQENVDLSGINVEMVTHTDGEFNYYDYNKEVTFPEISEEDILDITSIDGIEKLN